MHVYAQLHGNIKEYVRREKNLSSSSLVLYIYSFVSCGILQLNDVGKETKRKKKRSK